ncbi:hypothetical protein [Acetobacter senegalensis]|uniref:hypothetical protein n=1 Tax=Acetobacter senegalensis TaxID=446692 RepID=UPI00264C323C|nr:hypothetical protein [Acetobacter senegalensis]MDN7355528.1 hypothetical protein [Acetobacter senegalensis]
MTTLTNWPDLKRPGWPPNPERDGLYALYVGGALMARHWSAVRQFYTSVPGWPRGMSPFEASAFDFAGEILTPTQITEMLAAERERCLAAFHEHGERAKLGWNGSSSDEEKQYWRGALNTFQECCDEIRNLGDTP